MTAEPRDARRRAQHQQRLEWMPWLYFRLKAHDREWAQAWQSHVHLTLAEVERVALHETCFIAPTAHIFAEPGRRVVVGARASIGAEAYVHGPVSLGEDSSLNARTHLEGGGAGIHIGANTRIATGARLFAFDHGTAPGELIRTQPVQSKGIHIGDDVWVGAGAGITDGVTIGDGAVVAMGAVVVRDVKANMIVAGVPAREIRLRV